MSRDLISMISRELDEWRTERKDLQSQMNDMRTAMAYYRQDATYLRRIIKQQTLQISRLENKINFLEILIFSIFVLLLNVLCFIYSSN